MLIIRINKQLRESSVSWYLLFCHPTRMLCPWFWYRKWQHMISVLWHMKSLRKLPNQDTPSSVLFLTTMLLTGRCSWNCLEMIILYRYSLIQLITLIRYFYYLIQYTYWSVSGTTGLMNLIKHLFFHISRTTLLLGMHRFWLDTIYHKEKHSALKDGYLLTWKCLFPNSIGRQNGKLALKLFNRTIAAALEVLGPKSTTLKNWKDTALFIDMMIKFRNIVNVKTQPKELINY